MRVTFIALPFRLPFLTWQQLRLRVVCPVSGPRFPHLQDEELMCLLGEGLGGVKFVLVGIRELFPTQLGFLTPLTLILLFLAQEKACFPHEVTILATGSS